jgi:hypothetical protein
VVIAAGLSQAFAQCRDVLNALLPATCLRGYRVVSSFRHRSLGRVSGVQCSKRTLALRAGRRLAPIPTAMLVASRFSAGHLGLGQVAARLRPNELADIARKASRTLADGWNCLWLMLGTKGVAHVA